MKIGIVADTHDNIIAVQKAVQYFNTQNLNYVIHAGDYVAPFSLRGFTKLRAKFIGVFGNNDGERKGLLTVCKDIHDPPFDIMLDNKHIIVTHTIDSLYKRSLEYTDIVIYAHTHIPEIKRERTLFINPGECGGWLYGKNTVAILDIETFHADIIDLSSVV
ncbi:MAG TPA: metallophosphoesterase [Candidatus Brocadiaceae bacterium]